MFQGFQRHSGSVTFLAKFSIPTPYILQGLLCIQRKGDFPSENLRVEMIWLWSVFTRYDERERERERVV